MESTVVYTIDASDRIIRVNDAWTSFASQNDGQALLPQHIIGKSLWDYLTDDSTRQIYRRLVSRVRDGAGPVQFAFRCDSPEARRLLEMNIVADADHGVTFVVDPLIIEDRTTVSLLDPRAPRSQAVVRLCAWCKRLPGADGRWMEVEEGLSTLGVFETHPMPVISHGVCDECQTALLRALDRLAPSLALPIILGGPTSTLRPQ